MFRKSVLLTMLIGGGAALASSDTGKVDVIIPSSAQDENGSLVVKEGSSVTVQLKLLVVPTETVTFTMLSSIDELSATPQRLEFNLGSWHFAQRIKISAARDADNEDEPGTIKFNALGGNYDGLGHRINVVYVDDDRASPGDPNDPPDEPDPTQIQLGSGSIEVNASEIDVYPGKKGQFQARLKGKPTGAVILKASSTQSGVTIESSNTQNFTASNYSTWRTYVFRHASNVGTSFDIRLEASSSSDRAYDTATKSVRVNIVEEPVDNNDPPPTPASSHNPHPVNGIPNQVTIVEGQSTCVGSADPSNCSFNVWLPDKDVSRVNLVMEDFFGDARGETYIKWEPGQLEFTEFGSGNKQRLTFTVPEDADHKNGFERVHFFGKTEGRPYSKQVEFTIRDLDTAVLLSKDELAVNRNGGTTTISARLDERTSGAVTVSAVALGRDDLTISPASQTWSRSDWNSWKTFTVSVPANANPGLASIAFEPEPALLVDEDLYENVFVKVNVFDSDHPERGIEMSSVETHFVLPRYAVDVFPVRLKDQPDGDVRVDMAFENDDPNCTDRFNSSCYIGKVQPYPYQGKTYLTFTTENWNQWQSVSVHAWNEGRATVSLSGSGGGYGGYASNLTLLIGEVELSEVEADVETTALDVIVIGDSQGTVHLRPNKAVTGRLQVYAVTEEGQHMDSDGNQLTGPSSPISFTSFDNTTNRQPRLTFSGKCIEENDGVACTRWNSHGCSSENEAGCVCRERCTKWDYQVWKSFDFDVKSSQHGRAAKIGLFAKACVRASFDESRLCESREASTGDREFNACDWNSASGSTTILVPVEAEYGYASDANNNRLPPSLPYCLTPNVEIDVATIAGGDVSLGDTVQIDLNHASQYDVTKGYSQNFSVKLTRDPAEDVFVYALTTGAENVSMNPHALLFTSANWNVNQTMTLTADDVGSSTVYVQSDYKTDATDVNGVSVQIPVIPKIFSINVQ